MRYACIFVPHFVVQAALRSEPGEERKHRRAVAILDGPESLLRVFACNREAQLAGIATGMTKVQAEQCSGLILRKRIPAQEHAAQSALIDCASAFSPLLESAVEGSVTFDITGTDRVFGPPQTLARRVVESAAQLGFEVNVAIAENADAALIAAKGSSGIIEIPSGEEARCLAPLPIEVLSPAAEQAEVLDSWGIRTCGDLVALPPVPLVERLGQSGLQLQKLARGEVRRILIRADPPGRVEESMELEDSIEDLESLAFLLNRLLKQISRRLSARGLATNEIRLRLELEVRRDRDMRQVLPAPTSATFERRLKLPIPINDTTTLLKLLQLDLAAHNPSAPVKAVAIEAIPAKRRLTQAGLFIPRAPEPEKLELTLARLRSVVGETDEQGRSRVGAPQMCDSHKPDEFRVVCFTPQLTQASQSSSPAKTSIAINMFRPPLPARVRCKRSELVHISFARISARVLCAAGPWFTSGIWWDETQEWNREQWDVAIQAEHGVGLYRIFRDQQTQTWFVEGLYN
jgi:protein ImuB